MEKIRSYNHPSWRINEEKIFQSRVLYCGVSISTVSNPEYRRWGIGWLKKHFLHVWTLKTIYIKWHTPQVPHPLLLSKFFMFSKLWTESVLVKRRYDFYANCFQLHLNNIFLIVLDKWNHICTCTCFSGCNGSTWNSVQLCTYPLLLIYLSFMDLWKY